MFKKKYDINCCFIIEKFNTPSNQGRTQRGGKVGHGPRPLNFYDLLYIMFIYC
jgi:hypothetical protein